MTAALYLELCGWPDEELRAVIVAFDGEIVVLAKELLGRRNREMLRRRRATRVGRESRAAA